MSLSSGPCRAENALCRPITSNSKFWRLREPRSKTGTISKGQCREATYIPNVRMRPSSEWRDCSDGNQGRAGEINPRESMWIAGTPKHMPALRGMSVRQLAEFAQKG